MPSKQPDTNEAELRAAADAGDPKAMYRLGYALAERDEADEAERWYRRAADGGSTDAMWALGDRAESCEEFGEAERWFQRSAEAGNASGMCRLGNLLFERGEYEQADRWLRAAVDAGHDHALWRLTVVSDLLRRDDTNHWFHRLADAYELEPERLRAFGALRDARGCEEEAAYWYGRAAEAGHTDSMKRLLPLLRKLGDSAGALRWCRAVYQPDLEAGDWTALGTFTTYLSEAGEHAEAERWYRRAAADGDPYAMFELGHILAERGDHDETERLFRKAIQDSDDMARKLGEALDSDAILSWSEDDAAKAREAMDRLPLAQVLPLYRAVDRGDPDVWWEFGSVLNRCDYRDRGKGWRWSAAKEGHLRALSEVVEELRTEDPAVVEELLEVDLDDADLYEDCDLEELAFPCTLEQVLAAWDRRDEHEPRFRHAADTGHPRVMMWLGILLIHWGDEQEGRSWLQRAAEAGYPDAMYSLAMLLDSRDRQDDARPWHERVRQYRRRMEEEYARQDRRDQIRRDRDDDEIFARVVARSYERDVRASAEERKRLLAAT